MSSHAFLLEVHQLNQLIQLKSLLNDDNNTLRNKENTDTDLPAAQRPYYGTECNP